MNKLLPHPLRCFLSVFFIFVCLFAFLCFYLAAFLRFGAFWCFLVLYVLFRTFWGFFVRVRSFHKKNNKKFKIALITSFILLLNFQLSRSFSIITIFFNYYNLFQLSQFFSIITIVFNYYSLFQLSQFFSIITIFFNYHNHFQLQYFLSIITTCDTIFMKISQRTISII